MAATKSENS